MTKLIKACLIYLSRVFAYLSSFFNSESDKVINDWFSSNGDENLKMSFPLNKDSVVFEVGGYRGQWSSDIFSKYMPNIYVFEPVKSFYEVMTKRFEKNNKIKCFNFGLSNKDQVMEIAVGKDGSSYFRKSDETIKTKLVDVATFIKENKINSIDLMSINIEGGEYDLIDRLIKTGLVKIIKNIQVQFHRIDFESQTKMEKLQKQLGKTHKLTYQYLFVWENWKLKK